MKDKKTSIIMIIFIVCAVVWNMILLEEFLSGDINSKSFIIHIICAIVWDLNAIVWTIRYIKSKKNNG